MSRVFHMLVLSLPNAADASETLLLTSSNPFGTTLPGNMNSITCSTSVPSSVMVSVLGDRILHLVPFIFMSHFYRLCLTVSWRFSVCQRSLKRGSWMIICFRYIYRKGVRDCEVFVKVFQLFHDEFQEDIEEDRG